MKGILRKLIVRWRGECWRRRQVRGGVAVGRGFRSKGHPFALRSIELGKGVVLEEGVLVWVAPVSDVPQLTIGRNSYIGRWGYLAAGADLTIGKNVLFGPNVHVTTVNHRMSRFDTPIREQGYEKAPVMIGDNVWLGANVVVMPGVQIEEGAVVGANAVVTKSIPAGEIWGGVPARYLKTRIQQEGGCDAGAD